MIARTVAGKSDAKPIPVTARARPPVSWPGTYVLRLSERVLLLAELEDLERLLGSLDAAEGHGAESGTCSD